MSRNDRRDSLRLEVEPGRAEVNATQAKRIELRDVSATGGSLIFHGTVDVGLGIGSSVVPATFNLSGVDAFSTDLQIVRATPQESGALEIGARFNDLPTSALRSLSTFMIQEVHRRNDDVSRLFEGVTVPISNAVFIGALLGKQAVAAKRPLYVLDGQMRLPTELRLLGLDNDGSRRTLRAKMLNDAGLVLGREYTFLLAGSGAVNLFVSKLLERRGDQVVLLAPIEIRQTGYRASTRVALGPLAPAYVGFSNARVEGGRLVRPIADVAARGLSFWVDPATVTLFPGDRLSGLTIWLPDGQIQAEAVIRRIAPRATDGYFSCGVELFSFSDNSESRKWQDFVFKTTHPDLRLVNGSGAEDSWGVLERSKYLDDWVPTAHREDLRKTFLSAWRDPSENVGHALLLNNDEKQTVGLSAGSLLYPKTWMLHHLGVDESEQETRGLQASLSAARKLIMGILDRLQYVPDIGYFVIYLERDKRWNDRLFGDFALKFSDPGALMYTPFRLYRHLVKDQEVGSLETFPGYCVVPATPTLWGILSRHLRAVLSPLEFEAFAYNADEINLEKFSLECGRCHYTRRRDAFFAMEDGKPVAALIVELGGDGVNVFGLLNTCRIVRMTVEPNRSLVRSLLLKEAHSYYRHEGCRNFVFFESVSVSMLEEKDYSLFSADASRWIANRAVIPSWSAYLGDLLHSLAA